MVQSGIYRFTVSDQGDEPMPRLRHQVPKYRHHRASGQAMVTIHGRDYYLGRYRSAASRKEYNRLVAEYLARDRQPPPAAPEELTIVELIAAYWRHVKAYYRKAGEPTSEVHLIRNAMRPLKDLYGHTPAARFGPVALKTVRGKMVEGNVTRGTINSRVSKIKKMFRWAASEQLLPVTVYQSLATLDGLRKGRSKARESKGVEPVTDQTVQQTLPHLSQTVADMVRFQRLTGCRPGEVCAIRPCDVDRSGDVWEYRPESHKTEHRNTRARVIFVGPKGQDVLRPYLLREAESCCFAPAESQKKRYDRLRARARVPRRKRKQRRFRHLGPCYSSDSYRRAVHRACDLAGIRRWSPNQLRHSAGTEIRRRYGIEGSQVILGHADAFVTQVYAERDATLARRIVREIG